MNTKIALLLLGVVCAAVGIIFFGHVDKEDYAAPAATALTEKSNAKSVVTEPPTMQKPIQASLQAQKQTPTPKANIAATGKNSQTGAPAAQTAPTATKTPALSTRNATPTEPSPQKPVQEAATPKASASAPAQSSTAQPAYTVTTLEKNDSRPKTVMVISKVGTTDSSLPQANPKIAAQNNASASTKLAEQQAATPAQEKTAQPKRAEQQAGTPAQQVTQTTTEQKPATHVQATTAQPTIDEASISRQGQHSLRSITLERRGESMVLRITASSLFPCQTFALNSPERFVIDLPGTWNNMQSPSLPAQSLFIHKVRLGKQAKGPRLVLDLTTPVTSERVRIDETTLEITLNPQ